MIGLQERACPRCMMPATLKGDWHSTIEGKRAPTGSLRRQGANPKKTRRSGFFIAQKTLNATSSPPLS
jgi:hypothetical protein